MDENSKAEIEIDITTIRTTDRGMIKEMTQGMIKEAHTIKETEIHLGETQIKTILEIEAAQQEIEVKLQHGDELWKIGYLIVLNKNLDNNSKCPLPNQINKQTKIEQFRQSHIESKLQ